MKTAKKVLKVVFPDGNIMLEDSATQTFVRTIEHIGVARVASLNIKTINYDLLTKEKIKQNEKGKPNQIKVDGYWLTHGQHTNSKFKILEEISSRLDLNLQVYYF